jgi:Uncharacterized homolog of PSP1
MPEIIGVRFKHAGRIYYFSANGHVAEKGANVIVETARGTECGEVSIANRIISEEETAQPLKKVLRIATPEDIARMEENREKEAFAMQVCAERVAKHQLDMKLIDAEYSFDNSKVLFYFTADGRVDFRDLVRDLASVLRTRIELRQVGVRDEAKMLGGLGICGRPFCCSTFLSEFQPVSIKMAKEQGLSLNPSKISGTCGRLMCCLKYEQSAYEELNRTTPKAGTAVQTPDGKGIVKEVSLLTGKLKISLETDGNAPNIVEFHKSEIQVLRDKARPRKQNTPPPGPKPVGDIIPPPALPEQPAEQP